MRWTQRRRLFRDLLERPGCVYPASVFDPVSAKIAESLGYELEMLAGSIASFSTLGAPDMILITLSEFAGLARRINQASSLPLLVDADHGYGNAINVLRTVEELEIAGVAGLTIEDTLLPATYGTSGKSGMIPVEEGVGKMLAALAARSDPSLVIVGRTSAISIAGLDEAIKRAKAYAAAGVDAMFIAGVKTEDQLAALHAAVKVPVIVGQIDDKLMADPARLGSHNVKVCLQGHLPYMAAVQAVHDTLAALKGGTQPKDVTRIASKDTMQKVTRSDRYAQWERDFLGV